MRRFEPLAFVWSTLTIWHLVLPLAMIGLLGWRAISEGWSLQELMQGVPVALGGFALLYVFGAIILGQAFGDKYTFAQVWPSSALIGVLVSLGFVGWIMHSDPAGMPLGVALFVFLVFSLFMGLAFNFFLYLMPRMVGWFGIVEMPRLSWAVRLP